MKDKVIAGCKVCDTEEEIQENNFNNQSLEERARIKLTAHCGHCKADFTDTYIERVDNGQ